MKKEIYIALFIKFLKENNVYLEYQKLWSTQKRDCKDVKTWLFRTNSANYLFSAFSWPTDNWSLLHVRWLKLVEKNKRFYLRYGKELRTTRSI